jgi:hypothetical protein
MINKKLVIVFSVIIFFISVYSSYSYFSGDGSVSILSPLSFRQTTTPTTSNGNGEVVDTEPKTEECPINGQLLSKTQKNKWEKRRPMGIMIENHVEARPQSGLSKADVIYEAVAEGGITRFMGIFYCQDAAFVGPVRSARIYFVRLLEGYGQNPLYAHVGGANCDEETGSGCANGAKADALGKISMLNWTLYNDLNQFAVPFPYYWRDYERLPNVATEHTVYMSTTKMWDYAKNKRKLSEVDEEGVRWDKGFEKWKFADDASVDKRGTINNISFSFWSNLKSDFAVVWKYNKATNSYLRINGGKPHTDKNTGKQLEAKNVIVVLADEAPANDGYAGGHILYDIIGTGTAEIFQNGSVIKGTWKKADEESAMKFYDENDKEISIVRGQVFVEILPSDNKVTY